MRAKVAQWGHSLALRVPRHMAEEVGLSAGSAVELRVEAGGLAVSPVVDEEPTLAELVAQITEENRHELIDFGRPVGKEVW